MQSFIKLTVINNNIIYEVNIMSNGNRSEIIYGIAFSSTVIIDEDTEKRMQDVFGDGCSSSDLSPPYKEARHFAYACNS